MKLSDRLKDYLCGCGDGVRHDLIEQARLHDAVVDAARDAVASHAKTNITPTGPMREALIALDKVVWDE